MAVSVDSCRLLHALSTWRREYLTLHDIQERFTMSFVLDDGKKERDANEQEDILETFDKFDTDGDGFLQPEDLRQLMLRLGVVLSDDELQDMVKEADINKDGKIDFEEFHRIMMHDEPTHGQDLDVSTSKLNKGKT